MLRNREIKIFMIISILIAGIGTITCFIINAASGAIAFSFLILMFVGLLDPGICIAHTCRIATPTITNGSR